MEAIRIWKEILNPPRNWIYPVILSCLLHSILWLPTTPKKLSIASPSVNISFPKRTQDKSLSKEKKQARVSGKQESLKKKASQKRVLKENLENKITIPSEITTKTVPQQAFEDLKQEYSFKDLIPQASMFPKSSPEPSSSWGEEIGGDHVRQEGDIIYREFDLMGYFDKLNRRFSETWGNYRSLPVSSHFYGVSGEDIEYLFMINKDGSLQKVVNLSSQKQPHRDFSYVYHLVFDVLRNVFPIEPLPDRIQKDVLTLKKSIRFVGFHFGMF